MKTITYHLIGIVLLASFSSNSILSAQNLCGAQGNNISGEYIGKVDINAIENNSISTTTSGYTDYKADEIFDELEKGSTGNTISITKYWPIIPFPEAVSVWIDFNQNGSFTSDEKVLEDSSNEINTVNATFDVPTNAVSGDVVMRVIMKYYGTFGVVQDDPCETYTHGETEDYMLRISNQLSVEDTSLESTNIYPNPFNDSVTLKLPNNVDASTINYTIYDIQGRIVLTSNENTINGNSIIITMMDALNPGPYLIKIENTTNNQFITKRLIKQ
ncbi:GEVED domain-containing protein [Winogradskyella sp.]|uniref:GEVED domain-containing protein n=1 Tax=Winogradskyella sp. TaxID=1883156 RepID=UPI003F6BB600